MTDARIPERWLSDRRLLRLSDVAFRLHITALTWSVSNRTDGVLDEADLPLIPQVDPARVVELEKAGLWVRDRDTWVIVDYGTTQTSAHELQVLENVRRRDREKKARQRAKSGTVPGDSPGATSPGTAQARTGQDRTGQDLYEEGGNSWPEVHAPGRPSVADSGPMPDWAGTAYERES